MGATKSQTESIIHTHSHTLTHTIHAHSARFARFARSLRSLAPRTRASSVGAHCPAMPPSSPPPLVGGEWVEVRLSLSADFLPCLVLSLGRVLRSCRLAAARLSSLSARWSKRTNPRTASRCRSFHPTAHIASRVPSAEPMLRRLRIRSLMA